MKTQAKGRDAGGEGQDRRRYHHGDLRAALLVAAEAELEVSGIERLSLRAVAKRAGVSHAAPAHHFDGAAGLLTALAASGYAALDAALREAGDGAATPVARIEEAGVAYVTFAMERPALFRLMFSSARPDYDDADLRAASDAAFMALACDIQARTGDDPFETDAAMDGLMVAWGLVHGLADLMNAGRMRMLGSRPRVLRDRTIRKLVSQALSAWTA